jgi:sirohydrochlorin ferrochelatase
LRRSRAPMRTAVLLIGHGSRVAAANRLLRGLARRLRTAFPRFVIEACFLEAATPDIPAGVERCVARGVGRILLVPYFLYMGGHVRRDLPAAARAARRRHPGLSVRLAPHLGNDPRLVALLADRVRKGMEISGWS